MNFDNTDYFSLFGLPRTYTVNQVALKTRYYQLQQTVHPDKFADKPAAEKKVAQLHSATVNKAYQVLCSPLKRAIYLLTQHGVDVELETDTNMDVAFLSEQMALRERLAQGDYSALSKDIDASLQDYEKKLSILLDSNTVDTKALAQARQIARKMQFYDHLAQDLREKQES